MRSYTIFQKNELQLVACKGTKNPVFAYVMHVREKGKAGEVYDFDEYSTHYVLFQRSIPVATLASTRHVDGPIDCEQFYPAKLFEVFGDRLVSTCKFLVLQTNGLKTLRRIVRSVWEHRLHLGVAVDVINIRVADQRVFERIGYMKMPGSEFVHPKLGTNSIVMLLCTDPLKRSFVNDLFQKCDDPILFDDVWSHLREPAFSVQHKGYRVEGPVDSKSFDSVRKL